MLDNSISPSRLVLAALIVVVVALAVVVVVGCYKYYRLLLGCQVVVLADTVLAVMMLMIHLLPVLGNIDIAADQMHLIFGLHYSTNR